MKELIERLKDSRRMQRLCLDEELALTLNLPEDIRERVKCVFKEDEEFLVQKIIEEGEKL